MSDRPCPSEAKPAEAQVIEDEYAARVKGWKERVRRSWPERSMRELVITEDAYHAGWLDHGFAIISRQRSEAATTAELQADGTFVTCDGERRDVLTGEPCPADVTPDDWKEAYLALLAKVRDAVDYQHEKVCDVEQRRNEAPKVEEPRWGDRDAGHEHYIRVGISDPSLGAARPGRADTSTCRAPREHAEHCTCIADGVVLRRPDATQVTRKCLACDRVILEEGHAERCRRAPLPAPALHAMALRWFGANHTRAALGHGPDVVASLTHALSEAYCMGHMQAVAEEQRPGEPQPQPSTHRHEPVAAEWLDRQGLPHHFHPALVGLLSRVWCNAIDHARWQHAEQRRERARPFELPVEVPPREIPTPGVPDEPNACADGRHRPEPDGLGWCDDCAADLAPLLRFESDAKDGPVSSPTPSVDPRDAVIEAARRLHRELGFLPYVSHAHDAKESSQIVDDVVEAEEALGRALGAANVPRAPAASPRPCAPEPLVTSTDDDDIETKASLCPKCDVSMGEHYVILGRVGAQCPPRMPDGCDESGYWTWQGEHNPPPLEASGASTGTNKAPETAPATPARTSMFTYFEMQEWGKRIRRETIEECAKECEDNLHPDSDRWDAAKAIRALRVEPKGGAA